MRKFVIIATLLTVLVSCQQPTSTPAAQGSTETHVIITKDSLWNDVKRTVVTVSKSRDAVPVEMTEAEKQAKALADAHNAATLDDLWRVYVDEAPNIDNSPPVNVFICNPFTNIPNTIHLAISRKDLVENYALWKADAYGQVMFIDHIPPAPILAKDTTPYEWYSLYVVEDSPTPGTIHFEDHCGYSPDESFHGEWITLPEGQTAPDGTPGGGWLSVDRYFQDRLSAFRYEATSAPSHGYTAHVVYSQIYPPLPPIITDRGSGSQ